MNIEPNNPSAESVEEEEKVTGGATSNNENNAQENTAAPSLDDTETLPHEETKKEDVTGYNELPDQAKVAGG